MTDKQIIIDGFNLEYIKELLYNGQRSAITTKIFEEIIEKLERKEQECERLNRWLPIVTRLEEQFGSQEKAKGIDYKTYAEQIFAELDQLKAENNKYSLFIEKLCDYAGLECDDEEQAMRTLSDLASQMNKARWIIDRYKQTLTEIKEIVEKAKKDICNNCGWRNTDSCDPTDYICGDFIQILQKISECEVGDEK